MSVLNAARRNALPKGKFGLPAERAYPIEDAGHARAALSRAAQFATPAEDAEIKRNVRRDYPGMSIGGRKPKGYGGNPLSHA